MKILAFSDWRVQSREMINEIIKNEIPDVILYAGDDLDRVLKLKSGLFLQLKNHFFKIDSEKISDKSIFNIPSYYLQDFQNSILKKETPTHNGIELNGSPFYFVNGNDDKLIEKGGSYYIEKTNSIHIPFIFSDSNSTIRVQPTDEQTLSVDTKYQILSKKLLKSSLRSKESYKIEDEEITLVKYFYRLAQKPSFGLHKLHNNITLYGSKCGYGFTTEIFNLPTHYVDILLVHIPPLGVLDLSTRFKTKHIGSEAVLDYIKKFQPKFVVCGHSHMWGGHTDKIGESIIINISSHDNYGSQGNYAIINTEIENVDVKSKKTKTIRQLRGAYFKSEENFKIYGAIENWYNHDLFSLKNDNIINSLEKHGRNVIANRVRSFSWSKPKIIKKLSFNPSKHALIDVETGIPKFIDLWNIKCKLWLIGVYYNGTVHQFQLPRQRAKFVKFISSNNIKKLVSWTMYDSKVLRNMSGLEHIKWMDACKRATYSIVWHSYKLHELYNVVFENVDNEIIDGAIAGLYADHLIDKKGKCEFCPSEESVIKKIQERNRKDLVQLYKLCELLWNYENEE